MTQAIRHFRQHVQAQLGESEHPLGSNHQKYGAAFGWNDVSWCVEFGYEMYEDCGVELPIKTASCVVMYDESAKDGLVYASTNCVVGDSIIRTWEHKDRAHLDPAKTHFQVVVGTHRVNGVKFLDLIGGNQGPGIVSRDTVRAGDVSILGGLAFHKLFDAPQKHRKDDNSRQELPAAKSHKYPKALLSLGSQGPLVRHLQHKLQHKGFYRDHKVDGLFGRNTLAAVIAFQKHHWPHNRHEWDGVVGPKTYRALGF